MSARFKCNTCLQEFGDSTGSQSCPFCGSSDIVEKSGGIFFNFSSLKKFIIPAAIVIAIIIVFLILRGCSGGGLKIKEVNLDKKKCKLTVVMEKAPAKAVLQYSFDNGKTFQNNKNMLVKKSGTYLIVVRDDKKHRAAWPVPFTFRKDDICDCFKTSTDCHPIDTVPPPQIIGYEKTDEATGNGGQIIMHVIYGQSPIKYSIDSGKTYQPDSIFNHLRHGKYKLLAVDSLSRIGNYFEDIIIEPRIVVTGGETIKIPKRTDVEAKLNDLFMNPDDRASLDAVNKLFVNQTMRVDCDLIGIPKGTDYQLFQFLQRRYEGRQGSKKIEVQDLKCDKSTGKINYIRLREIPN